MVNVRAEGRGQPLSTAMYGRTWLNDLCGRRVTSIRIDRTPPGHGIALSPTRCLVSLPERNYGAACNDESPANQYRRGRQRPKEREIDHLPYNEQGRDVEAHDIA